MDDASVEPMDMPLGLLREITNDFSEERKLGSGSFGKVYEGVYQDGEKIAVKMLYDMPGLDDKQFQNEFKHLARLRHQNIVRLVGYCRNTREEHVLYEGKLVLAEKTHRALCLEFMPNGSLEKFLSDKCDRYDWHVCYRIIKGICQGLKYLHTELIYHLDLKPANVLLDENMVPRIADFGISRLLSNEQTWVTDSSLGTHGYAPPEFTRCKLISNKFDIFSLGVVIIKMMAGRAGYFTIDDMSSKEFTNLVQENWTNRLLETSNRRKAYSEQVKTCIQIGLNCVQEDRHKRPTIQDIVYKLEESETKCTNAARKDWLSIFQEAKMHKTTNILTGIDGFKIVGDSRLGSTSKSCGVPTNGTTHHKFQWDLCLEHGTTQPIEGATTDDYMVTADDVGTLAVDCTLIDKDRSEIPAVVTKALTGYLSLAPSTLVDQNESPRYKLMFWNGLSKEVFTKKGICAANGDPLKICLESNQQGNSSRRLLSAKIKIVVLEGDFNRDSEDSWTSEDFRRHIVRPRDKAGVVLTGELELCLKNGEADLRDATFIDNSKFTRSGKFRLGVMIVDDLGERVLEGITEPFTVKDRRREGSQKHIIPTLDDDVWRLKKISKDGVFHEALKGNSIFSVKDFLRSYYKHEHALRKVLTKATKLVWTTIVDHAKMCDPGKELYSFILEGHDVVLFFNSFYQIIGVTTGDQYTPFNDLDKPMQDQVGQWSKDAYYTLLDLQPDYEMDNGKPRPLRQSISKGSMMLEPKSVQGHQQKRKFNETDDEQSTSSSHSKQCTFKRLGVSNEDAPFDISVYFDSGTEQYCVNEDDISGSLTLHCPTTAEDEISGSVLMKQACLTIGDEAFDIPFANSDASIPLLDASIQAWSALADVPMYSRHSSFRGSDCQAAV